MVVGVSSIPVLRSSSSLSLEMPSSGGPLPYTNEKTFEVLLSYEYNTP
jgi:hypothetical protein